jgi:hypothetical protein
MKKILLLITVILVAGVAFAQMPAGGMRPAGNLSGHVFGKLTDNEGKALGAASILLMENKMDTVTKKIKQLLYKSELSQANGDFSFEDVALRGRYTLKISSVGFKPYEQAISFFGKNADGSMQPPSIEKDLGKVKLAADAKELQSVTVIAAAGSIKLNADKKVFNVEKNIMSAGGTGVDVMRNVPSVNVDIDGNITMRNSAPQL